MVTVNTTEGAAYGAAILAGVGRVVWPDVDTACEQLIRITGSTSPNAEAVKAYEPLYAAYRELYPALSPTFQRLGRVIVVS